ncbi:hypothetical protein FA95DRAFT_1597698 [Auriscalpium vulgare]|uniref:Uncharacterized protein n=1 Tax=Auriscalpium vulgare TaxID=40419 RepID=A0ACB8RIY9_9AGAM|nr:hypothetical protein FA95DRAFT_1597698 [Auriscalpium vulgare]
MEPSETVDLDTSRTPVSLIPPELLSRVFHFLVSIDPPRRRTMSYMYLTSFELGWIGVTHVCRRWRLVALDNPALWANIDFDMVSHHWLAEFISRVGTHTLLDVAIGGPALARPQQEYLSLEERFLSSTDIISRIRSLAFNSSSRHQALFNRFLQIAASTRLTNMEELYLEHVDHHPSYIVPTANIPHLKILRLRIVGLDWHSSRLSNLVDLLVRFPVEDPHMTRHTSVSDVCDALAFMTRLERLTLGNVLATASVASTETHHAPHVTLPALVEFRLDSRNNDCSVLLSRLSMPSLRILEVEQHTLTPPSSPICLHPSSTPELQFLYLNKVPLDWTSPFPPTLLHMTINHDFLGRHLILEEDSWYFPDLDIFAQRLRGSKLQTLILIHAMPTTLPTTAENMRIDMPDLKTLDITGSTADVFTLANAVDLPPTSSKRVQLAKIRGTSGIDSPSILTGLVKPFDSMNYLAHAISVVCDDSRYSVMSRLHLWPTPQDWSLQDPLASSHPTLSIEVKSARHSIMDTKAFTELFLDAVESLSLAWERKRINLSWRTWLSRARGVKLLRLRFAYTMEVVIQAMVPMSGASDVLFPSLETLVLAFPELATNPELAETLIACAGARQAAGFPIREVRLPKDAPWVDGLRAVVPVITFGTVDGRT